MSGYLTYFYNWLYTGDGNIPPPPDLPPPPVAPAPPQVGGNLGQAIVNDPIAQQIRQNAGQRAQGLLPPLPPIPPPLPPPMNGLNIINMNVRAPSGGITDEMLRSGEVLALRLRAHVRARQGEHGHVLARHHPSLTDEQLKARLLTGLDPEGEPAPTSGVSSRFASEEIFFKSLRAVHRLVGDALKQTREYLRDNLGRCAAADARLANLQAQAAPGLQIGEAARERTEAYNDLRLAVGVVADLDGHLPVQWDAGRKCLTLFPKYVIAFHHNEKQGVGFYGTGPRPNTMVAGQPPKGQGQQRNMTIFERAHPFNGPADSTLTVMVTPDAPLDTLGRQHNIENWGLVTHYPQHDDAAKTKIAGQA
jgi:hypothetical protein